MRREREARGNEVRKVRDGGEDGSKKRTCRHGLGRGQANQAGCLHHQDGAGSEATILSVDPHQA